MGRLTLMEQDLTNLGKFGTQIQDTTAQKASAERHIQYNQMLESVIAHDKKDGQTTTSHHI